MYFYVNKRARFVLFLLRHASNTHKYLTGFAFCHIRWCRVIVETSKLSVAYMMAHITFSYLFFQARLFGRCEFLMSFSHPTQAASNLKRNTDGSSVSSLKKAGHTPKLFAFVYATMNYEFTYSHCCDVRPRSAPMISPQRRPGRFEFLLPLWRSTQSENR